MASTSSGSPVDRLLGRADRSDDEGVHADPVGRRPRARACASARSVPPWTPCSACSPAGRAARGRRTCSRSRLRPRPASPGRRRAGAEERTGHVRRAGRRPSPRAVSSSHVRLGGDRRGGVVDEDRRRPELCRRRPRPSPRPAAGVAHVGRYDRGTPARGRIRATTVSASSPRRLGAVVDGDRRAVAASRSATAAPMFFAAPVTSAALPSCGAAHGARLDRHLDRVAVAHRRDRLAEAARGRSGASAAAGSARRGGRGLDRRRERAQDRHRADDGDLAPVDLEGRDRARVASGEETPKTMNVPFGATRASASSTAAGTPVASIT